MQNNKRTTGERKGTMFFREKRDLNKGYEEFKTTPGAVLLDVRNRNEYQLVHLSESINLPLNQLKGARNIIPQTDTPVFVYCVSGARAGKAVKRLTKMGYTDCRNIGGLNGYRGIVVKG